MTKSLFAFASCIDCILACKIKPISNFSVRGLRYNKKGGLIGGRKKLPLNWRVLNFNPARIPSAWKPKDWDEKHRIDYEYEKELAKYIPGYKIKVPNHLKDNYHEETLFDVDASHLVEGLKQSLFLTKSVIADKGLPERIYDCANSSILPDQDDDVIQVFQHAHLFDVDPESIPKVKRLIMKTFDYVDNFLITPPPKRYAPLIMQELIRLCQTRGHQLTNNLHERMLVENIVSRASLIRECTSLKGTHVPNFQKKFKLKFAAKANMQVQAQNPLPLYADKEAVDKTKDTSLHSIHPVMPVTNIKKTNNYDFVTSTGITTQFAKPYLRTMAIFNPTLLSPNLLYSTMLNQLFATLYSQAVQIHGPAPRDLPEPLAAQCVASDGRVFQFMCLQLNTTKLDSDEGIKNMVWVDNEKVLDELDNVDDNMSALTMYSECSHTTWKSPDYYLNYDPEVFKLFQGFWLNGLK